MKKFVATLLVAPLLASSAPAMAAVAGPYAGRHAAIGLGAVQFRAAMAPEAAPAPAGETETFEALISQATEKFKDKDYAGAVALFERAYQLQKEPAILFNIGRIYEEAQNAEAAIGYYEKFIADESVELKDREKAVQRLQVLRTIVEIREKEKQKSNPQPQAKPDPVTPPPQTGPTPPDKQQDPKPAQPNRLLRPVGYAMFGTGALLVIGGAIAGGLARGQERAAADAETLADREAADQLGRSRAITADALFITGGLVAAIGVILLVVPSIKKARTDKARAMRSLTPHVSPTQVGLGFTHRF
jgi:tetratricopeptide (TPR) repeat protein